MDWSRILGHDLYLIVIRRYVVSGLSGLCCLSGLFGQSRLANDTRQTR
jgi:hypothetical protein